METSAAQHGSTGTGNDTGSSIKFGPMTVQQGTYHVKLRHEGNTEAAIYNSLLLHFVEAALRLLHNTIGLVVDRVDSLFEKSSTQGEKPVGPGSGNW